MDKAKKYISIVVGSFAIILSNQSISMGQTSALASRQIETEGFQQQIDDMRLEILRLSQKLSESVAGKQELTKNDENRLNVFAPGLKSLKIGGETRVRFEANANFDFNDSDGDGKEFTLLRTRLNFDAEINDHISAFLELQDNRLFGEEADAGPTASDFATGFPLFLSGGGGGTIGNLNRVDVLQSYVDVSLFERESSKYDTSNLSFRIGRWQMNYGGQKIISPLDWLNQGRAWDGIRMRYEQKRWAMPFWVDVFATQLDEDFVDAGRGGEDEDKIFTGIYGHLDWQ
ncbi:MAG: alginate export family protein, partial [Candidatus Anammoxibacter sp.]